MFQVVFGPVGGADGLMYRSAQTGADGALPLLVMVTLIWTGSPAAKLALAGERLIEPVRSGKLVLVTYGKYA